MTMRYDRLLMLVGMLVFLFAFAGCDSSTTVDTGDPQVDGDKAADGDKTPTDGDKTPADGDGEKTESEEEAIPCEEGDKSCANEVTVLICKDGALVFSKTCEEGQICRRGVCFENVADGDQDQEIEVVEQEPELEYQCIRHQDCDYGFGCDQTSHQCVNRMECNKDSHCDPDEICIEEPESRNWKICVPSPNECSETKPCEFGYKCEVGEDTWTHCVAANECTIDQDCGANMICTVGPQWMVCQPSGKICRENSDCEYGYLCHTELTQPVCIYESNCKVDDDCPTLNICQEDEETQHFKKCVFNYNINPCQKDEDCGPGRYCEILVAGYGSCKSKNKCTVDADCEAGFECKNNGEFLECTEKIACQSHAECGFGYECWFISDPHECRYANKCKNDDECPAGQVCKAKGNWTECQAEFPTICTTDDDCPEDKYCNTLLGLVGNCRSRSKCFVDEDCGEKMACQSNGVYNECVAANPKACTFDLQCQDGWACKDGTCRPLYEGVCETIEGEWSVVVSDCTLITLGQTYEYIPKDGCTGTITATASNLPAGSFEEQEDGSYKVALFYIMQCTGTVTLDLIQSLTCPTTGGATCSIQMARL